MSGATPSPFKLDCFRHRSGLPLDVNSEFCERLDESYLAEGVRFELTEPLRVRQFSRLVP